MVRKVYTHVFVIVSPTTRLQRGVVRKRRLDSLSLRRYRRRLSVELKPLRDRKRN